MVVRTVTEAKANLSALLERVDHGEEITICRAGKPVALLSPYRSPSVPRKPGRLRGKIRIAADFDDLPTDLARHFGVDDP